MCHIKAMTFAPVMYQASCHIVLHPSINTPREIQHRAPTAELETVCFRTTTTKHPKYNFLKKKQSTNPQDSTIIHQE
jgi:hypothetical protein